MYNLDKIIKIKQKNIIIFFICKKDNTYYKKVNIIMNFEFKFKFKL